MFDTTTATTSKILIVDDDEDLHFLIPQCLPDFRNFKALADSTRVTKVISEEAIDLVILDHYIEPKNGLEVLHDISQSAFEKRPAVIFVSAVAGSDVAKKALSLGAKQFLKKPFTMPMFQDAVKNALLNKEESFSNDRLFYSTRRNTRVRRGPFWIHPSLREVSLGEATYKLTDIEFRILMMFLSNPKTILSREEISRQIWGEKSIDRKVFEPHLSRLRKKIPAFSDRLRVVRGKGYLYQDLEM